MSGSHGPEVALVESGHLGLIEALGEGHHAGVDHPQGEITVLGLQVAAAG
jgi:hypothetical protein